jgi:hypothetical protein
MTRDKGLEALVHHDLRGESALDGKAMFGGWAWLLNGNLLCCARDDGMLVRLGKGNDRWALHTPGIVQMVSNGRRMQGWVRAGPEVYCNDALRRKLLDAALVFVRALRPK